MTRGRALAALLRKAADDFAPRGEQSWEDIADRLIAAGVLVMPGFDYPRAVQCVAALEDRIREYQAHVAAGSPVEFAVADSHAAMVAIREAFGIERPVTFAAGQVERRCIFDGCVATWQHWHGGFPGGYDNPADPEGPPIPFTGPDPEPGAVRDYNSAALEVLHEARMEQVPDAPLAECELAGQWGK